MIKLPPARRIIRPQRPAFRSWLAIWLQQRRRKRAVPTTPNAPVITGSAWAWNQTEEGFVDIYLEFTFEHGAFPVASFEVCEHDENNSDYVAATPQSDQISFWH